MDVLIDRCSRGDLEFVKAAMDADASVRFHRTSNGETLLHHAGTADMARFLVESGHLLVNDPISVRSPLMSACAGHRNDVAEYLIRSGADVSFQSIEYRDSALHHASSAEIVELLVSRGANIEAQDRYRRTPLHWAAFFCKFEVFVALVRCGAKLDTADLHGRRVIHLACESGCLSIVDWLLADGIDVNTTTEYGVTPLHSAAMKSQARAVEFLLARGADKSVRDCRGLTPRDVVSVRNLDLRRVLEQGVALSDSVDAIVREIVTRGFASVGDLVPASDSEIADIEHQIGAVLPRTYRQWLKAAGNGAGNFWGDYKWRVAELKEVAFDCSAFENESVSSEWFPFLSYRGDYVLLLKLDRSDNPEVVGLSSSVKPLEPRDRFLEVLRSGLAE